LDRAALEEGAKRILLTNLRQGVADWNGQVYSFVCPSLTGYPFQWFWDSCFHAIALLHLDPDQAKAELRTLMSGALSNGFMPHIIFWEMEKQPDFLSRNIVGQAGDPHYSSTMQPPIIAYAVERVYRATGDEEFRKAALPVLVNFYRWLRNTRDPDDDGLIAVIQPEEAGTDCSPKYDEALGLTELSNQGFIAALREIYKAYETLRGDDRKILAADLFHAAACGRFGLQRHQHQFEECQDRRDRDRDIRRHDCKCRRLGFTGRQVADSRTGSSVPSAGKCRHSIGHLRPARGLPFEAFCCALGRDGSA